MANDSRERWHFRAERVEPTRPRAVARPGRRALLGGALGALGAIMLTACGGGGGGASGSDSIGLGSASSAGGGSAVGGTTSSSNAALAGLGISASALVPAFGATTTAYAMDVANAVSSVTLVPTVADGAASVRVNGIAVASGATSAAVDLAVGANTVSVVVTAGNGTTTQTYSVVVTRAATASPGAAAPDAVTLAGLDISAGTLAPAFASATSAYAIVVPGAVGAISIKPAAGNPAATVFVNGVAVASGTASQAISLGAGVTTISVLVAVQGSESRLTYTLSVTRSA